MKDLLRKFPATRLRRNRLKSGLRSILAESDITVNDLIQPIFIKENLSGYEPIVSMPDVNRIGEDVLSCLLYTSPSPRDQRGSRMPSSA